MTKSLRHGQILRLIRSQEIYTQEELAQALKGTGVEATQVTLSRDVREMGLVKTASGYREMEGPAPAQQFAMLAGEFLREVRIAQNQLVLRTSAGHASSVAVAIDREDWPEVVGTIAGDDTILVICPDSATAESLRVRLLGLLE